MFRIGVPAGKFQIRREVEQVSLPVQGRNPRKAVKVLELLKSSSQR
jgi:DNA-binding protein